MGGLRSNPALLLEVSDLTKRTDVMPVKEHKRSIHATESKRERRERERGNMHDLETWSDGGGDQYHSTMQQEPKANRHKNRSHHAYSPFSPSFLARALDSRRFSASLSLTNTDALAVDAPASLQRLAYDDPP